ncbi:hypothetical protein BDK51DRAFT_32128 [Blyttiomyces helicus]|uniref:Uncharacterized protein n=1 Tax=Blyttiomyces helicus TaxID=388810 RepID=A0A4P9W6E5_9FUNG|nr:hypothetical protein BDK51DRAFT_32128 [Blyttiomyces helicus]|eukprot:RKO85696.1 hypothetical protein BDK51DRAFT_32128 [Blyttiomyces helicus]
MPGLRLLPRASCCFARLLFQSGPLCLKDVKSRKHFRSTKPNMDSKYTNVPKYLGRVCPESVPVMDTIKIIQALNRLWEGRTQSAVWEMMSVLCASGSRPTSALIQKKRTKSPSSRYPGSESGIIYSNGRLETYKRSKNDAIQDPDHHRSKEAKEIDRRGSYTLNNTMPTYAEPLRGIKSVAPRNLRSSSEAIEGALKEEEDACCEAEREERKMAVLVGEAKTALELAEKAAHAAKVALAVGQAALKIAKEKPKKEKRPAPYPTEVTFRSEGVGGAYADNRATDRNIGNGAGSGRGRVGGMGRRITDASGTGRSGAFGEGATEGMSFIDRGVHPQGRFPFAFLYWRVLGRGRRGYNWKIAYPLTDTRDNLQHYPGKGKGT